MVHDDVLCTGFFFFLGSAVCGWWMMVRSLYHDILIVRDLIIRQENASSQKAVEKV